MAKKKKQKAKRGKKRSKRVASVKKHKHKLKQNLLAVFSSPKEVKIHPKAEKPKKDRSARAGEGEVQEEEVTLDKTAMRIYLQQIEKIPLLTPDEEVSLAKKIDAEDSHTREAREKMIRSNLRLVISIAKRYINIGLPFSDLVEEGNIGLMRAVDKFNHKKGYRF